jgi:small conductance mechanosensitive channel
MGFPPITVWLPLIYFAVILVLTWALGRLAGIVTGRVVARTMPPVAPATSRLATLIVWIIGVTFALQEIGVSADILLLVILILGFAAIVAFREPLQNLGARYFSDIYTPFKLGDTVRVGEHSGKVIEINPITTVLLTDADTLVSVPNSLFVRDVVTNLSPQAWREVIVPFSVGGGVDLAVLESDLRKSLGKLRLRLDPRFPPVLTTRARTPLSTELTLTVMIRQPEDRDAIQAEVGKRVAEIASQGRRPASKSTAPA